MFFFSRNLKILILNIKLGFRDIGCLERFFRDTWTLCSKPVQSRLNRKYDNPKLEANAIKSSNTQIYPVPTRIIQGYIT